MQSYSKNILIFVLFLSHLSRPKKKLPMFLSRLNEISGRCEKIVKVANAFLRAKLEEKCELLRTDNGHRLT